MVPIRVPAAARARRRTSGRWPSTSSRNSARATTSSRRRSTTRSSPSSSSYPWPGNARELRNIVERMAILTAGAGSGRRTRSRSSCAPRTPRHSSLQQARDSAEREHLLRALDDAGWNVSAAARALGMERTNLHKRIRALGLKRYEERLHPAPVAVEVDVQAGAEAVAFLLADLRPATPPRSRRTSGSVPSGIRTTRCGLARSCATRSLISPRSSSSVDHELELVFVGRHQPPQHVRPDAQPVVLRGPPARRPARAAWSWRASG